LKKCPKELANKKVVFVGVQAEGGILSE